jgi:hypothetical protein
MDNNSTKWDLEGGVLKQQTSLRHDFTTQIWSAWMGPGWIDHTALDN